MDDTPSYPTCRTPACRTTPTPGYADRGLCQHHETAGLQAIEALHDDWTRLQPLIWDKTDPGPSTASPAPFGPTLPMDLGADALAHEICYTAVVWDIAVRERAGLSDSPGQDGMAGGRELAAAAVTLAAHYSVLMALGPTDHMSYERQPATADGVDAAIALTVLHRRARARIGVDSKTYTVNGDCPVCGWQTLRHRDGSEDVYCEHCEHREPWADYQDRVGLLPLDRAA